MERWNGVFPINTFSRDKAKNKLCTILSTGNV